MSGDQRVLELGNDGVLEPQDTRDHRLACGDARQGVDPRLAVSTLVGVDDRPRKAGSACELGLGDAFLTTDIANQLAGDLCTVHNKIMLAHSLTFVGSPQTG